MFYVVLNTPMLSSLSLRCILLPQFFSTYKNSHRRCSKIKVFLKISQNLQKSTCSRVSFNRVASCTTASVIRGRNKINQRINENVISNAKIILFFILLQKISEILSVYYIKYVHLTQNSSRRGSFNFIDILIIS